jgi:hypothetical protein
MLLTAAGRDLGMAAFREASTTFAKNLIGAVRASIKAERDVVEQSKRWGVSHDRLAAVGRLNDSLQATLQDRLFDRLTVRGRATRLVLPAIRRADLPDLAALRQLAASEKRDASLAKLARHALALEEVTCAADWALERVLAGAIANGYAIAVDEVPAREKRWSEIEARLRRAAAHASSTLAEADLPNEHATAAAFAELSGAALVRELVVHHERVMTGRSARRWAALEGDRIHAQRIQPVPPEPEPIRHAYRFRSARQLARQAGLGR